MCPARVKFFYRKQMYSCTEFRFVISGNGLSELWENQILSARLRPGPDTGKTALVIIGTFCSI